MRGRVDVPLFIELRSKKEQKALIERTGIEGKISYPVAVVFKEVGSIEKEKIKKVLQKCAFEFYTGNGYSVILTTHELLERVGRLLRREGLEGYSKWILNSVKAYPPPMKIGCRSFDFKRKIYIMGVINLTPDSFYSESRKLDVQLALNTALRMEEEGVDIIDIGGESTRPGSRPIPAKEEIKRVIPVLRAFKSKLRIPISVDTYKADVAEAAIKEGADMINDISGLRFDSRMQKVVLKYRIPVVIMHTSGRPNIMQKKVEYKWLLYDVVEYLSSGMRMLGDEFSELVILDPGIGFGKTPEANLYILNHLEFLKPFRRPIMVGVSRKSFIGFFGGGERPEHRLEGTISSIALAVLRGANIVRVHDVGSVRKALNVLEGLRNPVEGVA